MAFPFETQTHSLRRALLRAIGAGSALALGFACDGSDQTPVEMPKGGDMTTPTTPTSETPNQPAPTTPTPAPFPAVQCSVPTSMACYTQEQMYNSASWGCGMIAPDPPLTEAQIAAKFLHNGCLAMGHACDGCCNPAAAEGEPQADGSCCYVYCSEGCCGRPFIVDGLARTARPVDRDDWRGLASTPPPRSAADGSLVRRRIADAWLSDALMEHASVASFARFTLELLAHGAPADLVAAAQQAGVDEVAHAQLCFGLAEHFGAVGKGPGPLAAASSTRVHGDLTAAALSALVEGCLGETLAAAEAEAALSVAVDPAARQALTRIAADERAHAELAFRFVAWAVKQVGPALSAAVEQRVSQALGELVDTASEAEREPAAVRHALHHAGRLTDHERCHVRRETLVSVLQPCLRALTAAPAAA